MQMTIQFQQAGEWMARNYVSRVRLDGPRPSITGGMYPTDAAPDTTLDTAKQACRWLMQHGDRVTGFRLQTGGMMHEEANQ